MKKIISLAFIIMMISSAISAISPYYKLEVRSGDIPSMVVMVKEKLATGGFNVIGEYHPGGFDHLYVIAFTNDEMTKFATSVTDRGSLASVMKVGFTYYDGKVTVSVTNPEYIFYAYLRDAMNVSDLEFKALDLSNRIISALSFEGTLPTGFGGDLSVKDLKKYHYMIGMPYFDDPVELRSFRSFEEGVETIRTNLSKGIGKTVKVYELVVDSKKVALFGVGLLDPEKGESHFLPIVGEDHVAAMPYEIILQGNKATMLHGRYRFALLWPELKMVTFTKIMSSPGNVEDFLKALTE